MTKSLLALNRGSIVFMWDMVFGDDGAEDVGIHGPAIEFLGAADDDIVGLVVVAEDEYRPNEGKQEDLGRPEPDGNGPPR